MCCLQCVIPRHGSATHPKRPPCRSKLGGHSGRKRPLRFPKKPCLSARGCRMASCVLLRRLLRDTLTSNPSPSRWNPCLHVRWTCSKQRGHQHPQADSGVHRRGEWCCSSTPDQGYDLSSQDDADQHHEHCQVEAFFFSVSLGRAGVSSSLLIAVSSQRFSP